MAVLFGVNGLASRPISEVGLDVTIDGLDVDVNVVEADDTVGDETVEGEPAVEDVIEADEAAAAAAAAADP